MAALTKSAYMFNKFFHLRCIVSQNTIATHSWWHFGANVAQQLNGTSTKIIEFIGDKHEFSGKITIYIVLFVIWILNLFKVCRTNSILLIRARL